MCHDLPLFRRILLVYLYGGCYRSTQSNRVKIVQQSSADFLAMADLASLQSDARCNMRAGLKVNCWLATFYPPVMTIIAIENGN